MLMSHHSTCFDFELDSEKIACQQAGKQQVGIPIFQKKKQKNKYDKKSISKFGKWEGDDHTQAS
jgi:hypothetical protein